MARAAQDRLTLLREIVVGPSGPVYVADRWTPFGPALAAVKALHGTSPPARLLTQLRDEGALTARLAEPALAGLSALARVDGRPALVRAWIPGMDLGTLGRRLAQDGSVLPARAACEVLARIASALEVADRGRIRGLPSAAPRFHGDLKPSNVIIRPDGTVCLVDVGAGVTALGGSLSGSLDSRFRDPMGRAGPPADVYAVGRLAAELFGAPEASSEPAAAPGKAHDRRVRRLVSRLQLDGIAAADAATLRTLIARCMGSSSSSRPSAGQAAGILHEIADRAMGPGLASFCRTRLATWVTEPPLQPDASVRAITVARWTEHLDDADPSTITEEAPSITEHLSADFEATTVRIPVVHRSGDEELTIRLPLPGRSARVLIGLTGLFAGFAVMTCMGSTLVAALVGAWEAGLLG